MSCCNYVPDLPCYKWNNHLREINEILAGMNVNIQVDENDHRNSSLCFNYLPVEFHKVFTLSTYFYSVEEMNSLKRHYDAVFAKFDGEGVLKEEDKIVARTADILFLLDTRNVVYSKLKLVEL